MNKKQWTLLSVFLLLGSLAITNPSEEQYVTWAKEQLMNQSNGFLGSGLVSLFGKPLLESTTATNDYVFFSTFKAEGVTTLGVLKNFIPLGKISGSTPVFSQKNIEKPKPTSPPNTTEPVNSQSNDSIPSTAPQDTSNDTLLKDFTAYDVTIKVPSDWIQTKIGGGDWWGYKFINPEDGSQELTIVRSGCVGCTMNTELFNQGIEKPDPNVLVPRNSTSSFVFNNGASVGYDYSDVKMPYPTHGVVTISKNMSGYAKAEITLQDSKKPLATEVLNSFQLRN